MQNSNLAVQTWLTIAIANLQNQIVEVSDKISAQQSLNNSENLPQSASLSHLLDYLNRRVKLLKSILESGNLEKFADISELILEFEEKLQSLYFQKHTSSYSLKVSLEYDLSNEIDEEKQQSIKNQLEICELEILIQHLNLILIQAKITDGVLITNVYDELKLEVQKQESAYYAYVHKLIFINSTQAHMQLLTKDQDYDREYAHFKAILFGHKLEAHRAWCYLQAVIKTESFDEKIMKKFDSLIGDYQKYYNEHYYTTDNPKTDFYIAPEFLEKLILFNSELGHLKFKHSDEIVELYAHSLLRATNKEFKHLHAKVAARVDEMAHGIVALDREQKEIKITARTNLSVLL